MVRCRLARGAQPLRHRLRDATSPNEGRPWHSAKPCLFARGSPTRGNGDDRRQRRKQGVAVGAAASRMQATAQQTLGAATRPCLRSETERLDEGQPGREALAELNLSVIAYAMPPPLARGGLGIPQSFASSPEAPLLGATATTAASGGYRESLLGPRPAGCKRQRSRRWEPQPGLVCEVRLRGWTKDSLAGKLLLGSTSPSRLTPCHLPYRGEALA